MYPFAFTASIEEHWFEGKYAYTVVWLPAELLQALPLKRYPRLRVTGEIAEHAFEGACMPVRGRWYLMVPRKMMTAIGVGLGDDVEVRFEIADQDAVEIPAALSRALSEDEALCAAWDALTPGRQRSLAYPILNAKRPETIAKRLTALRETLL